MLRKDDVSRGARPSLLTPAQQAEADRNRILSTLETGGGKTGFVTAQGWSQGRWIGVGIVVVVAVAGSVALLLRNINDDSNSAKMQQKVAQAQTRVATRPLERTVITPAAMPAPATILEDYAAQQAAVEATRPTPAASKADASDPLAAFAPVDQAPPKEAPKESPKPTPKPKPKPAKPVVKKEAHQARTVTEQENDVLLLSALVAHANAVDPDEARPKRHSTAKPTAKPTLKEQLAQCRKLATAKAADCRKRVCDGRSGATECKVQR